MTLLPMHAWHPVMIHVPLVALPLAAALDLVAWARPSGRWRDAGTTLWWVGLAGAAAAVATGLLAFNRVDHSDPSHELMTLHRNLAFGSLAVLLAAAIWRWRRPPARGAAALAVAGALGLGLVGYLGGEMVYRHGLGIATARLSAILQERGAEEPVHMPVPSSGSALEPAADSAAAPDSSARTDTSALLRRPSRTPHTHAPGREH